MIRINGKYGLIEIPDCWEELSEDQYLAVSGILLNLTGGNMDLIDLRLNLLKALTGYSRSKERFSQEDQERIDENLYLLSEMVRFPIRPKYENMEVMEVLSEPLRDKLRTHFPFEIYDKKYLGELKMVEGLLKYGASINFNMKRNPLLSFRHLETVLHGPFFECDRKGLAITDMTAGEFVDAYEYYSLYLSTQDELYMRKMCLTLYRENRAVYGNESRIPGMLATVPIDARVQYAVFLFFQNFMEYLVKSPYGLLFGKSEKKSEGISLGMISTIYSLSKEGYGTTQEISRLNLADYLNMLLKQLIDAVKSLRSLKKTDTQIAEELEINYETVRRI